MGVGRLSLRVAIAGGGRRARCACGARDLGGVVAHPLRRGRRLDRRRGTGGRLGARRARHVGREARPLHGQLAPRRAAKAGEAARPARSRLRLGEHRPGASAPAQARDRRAGDALGNAGLGERRKAPERAPEEPVLARGLRGRRLRALPVDPPLGSVERAQPAGVHVSELAAPLRAAPVEPGLRRAPPAEPRQPRRRRGDLAAAHAERALACRVHARDARGARQARRVLAPSRTRSPAARRRSGSRPGSAVTARGS